MENQKTKGLKSHNFNLNKLIKESLGEALILLMDKKAFSSITITELCKKAGVSRMAFYGNYSSKEDLLKKVVLESVERLLERIGSPFRQTTNLKWYEEMFNSIKEDEFCLRTIFRSGFKHEYLIILNELVLHDPTVSAENKYLRIIWTGGVANVIISWIEEGLKEPPEEMAKFCFDNLSVWAK